jgi:hypothetical protein
MANEPTIDPNAPKHTIQITVDHSGHVSVAGPLENKILMYGLLDLAKEVVAEYNRNAVAQREKAEAAEAAAASRGDDVPSVVLPFGKTPS